MAFPKHCCPSVTVRHARALIAPIAVHAVIGRRRTLMPSIPPSAATATVADRAMRVQRAAPRVAAPGWLAVAKTGERKTMEAPARRARRRSTGPCAELVMRPWACRSRPGQRPARRCTPARSAAASRTSPATTKARRRARQILASSRPSASRPGSPSWRRTTPASPRGSRAAAARGSGSRRASVNSQSKGRRAAPRRAAAARAQAASRTSTAVGPRWYRHGRTRPSHLRAGLAAR